jgi:enoyl-CoA hydratase/carnithine racemase
MKDRVSIDMTDGVADVRLIRADKMNALDAAMFEGLIEAGDRLAKLNGLRAVVLSGEGKAFCAGLDMASFAAMNKGDDNQGDDNRADGAVPGARDLAARTHGIANRPQQCAWLWRELPVPVIAAVHGVALGGGFQIALGADIRYATADTRFSVMEIKWGLVPDLAGTQLMRHLAREDIVRELTYTGRVFSGEEARQYGFVTRIVADPRAAAFETAREIAGKSPDAIRAAKRLLNLAVATDARTGLIAESVEQQKLIGAPNQVEAVMSNLQKRAANYKD